MSPPRHSQATATSAAYPPRSSVRSSLSGSRNNPNNGSSSSSNYHNITNTVGGAVSRHRSPSPQQQSREEWPSSRRSSSESPLRANSTGSAYSRGATTTTTTHGSGSNGHRKSRSPMTRTTTTPATSSSSSITTKHRPWNNPEEFELLPTRGMQNQTGGAARARTTSPSINSKYGLSEGIGLYPTTTTRTISSNSNQSQQQMNSAGNSRGRKNKEEDNYDAYGYSDYYVSSSLPPKDKNDAAPEEDAYARYLQQKEQSSALPTANDPATLADIHPSASDRTTKGRPPRRSPSPPGHLLRSCSNGADGDLREVRSEQYSSGADEDDGDGVYRNTYAAATSARELRARRLAQQHLAQTTNDSSNSEMNLRMQSHNPAVQAYLARKEKERTTSTTTTGRGIVQRSHSINGTATNPTVKSSTKNTHSSNFYGNLASSRDATRRHSINSSSTYNESGGRPPAAPTPASSVQIQSNMTTYTYKFQPQQQSLSATADADIMTKHNALEHQQQQQYPSAASQPLRIDDNSHGGYFSSDTSVIRARRLLLQSSSSRTNATSSSSNDHSDNNYNDQRYHHRPHQLAPMRSVSDPPLINRYTGDSNAPNAVASDGANFVTCSNASKGVIHHAHSISNSSNNSSNYKDFDDDDDKKHSYSHSSSSLPSSSFADCSVTRARRLLQEGKGRSSSTHSLPTSTISGTAPSMSMVSDDAGDRPNGAENISTRTNSTRGIAGASGRGSTGDSSSTPSVPAVPSPHSLQSIPPDLENDVWSVRVCVISAVDFPVHVVPNMPLSPVLKIGLVSVPSIQESAYGKEKLLREIDRKGLGAVSDQMRCTTTKLLSKRDNGAVEFHEELRWDDFLLKPASEGSVALAVELCARGVLRPANLHESPPPHNASTPEDNQHKSAGGARGLFTPLRNRVVLTPATAESPSDVSSNNNPEQTGRGGRIMNFLQRKASRPKGDAAAMESAQAAAAVAKLLVQGSTSPVPPGKGMTGAPATTPPPPTPVATSGTVPHGALSRSQSEATSQNTPKEWDVTLRTPPMVVSPPSPPSSSPTSTDVRSLTAPVVMTDDIRLGSLLIPLTELEDLQRVLHSRGQPARLEKWFEVQNMNSAVMNSNNAVPAPGRFFGRDTGSAASSRSQSPNVGGSAAGGGRSRRNPSILLELSLYPPDLLDESEDEMEEDQEEESGFSGNLPQHVSIPKSFAKRTTVQVRNQLRQQVNSLVTSAASNSKSPRRDNRKDSKESARSSPRDPALEPGVIDFIAVVGARDIGDQKQDDGSKGWVQSTPECCLLEQFPPTEDFHVQQSQDRVALLPQKVEWFCFPDGVKLWRGPEPPTASDFLSQQEQQQQNSSPIMTPSQIMVSEAESTSLALFDAYLNCTTSFNWFVISSNSDKYGSGTQKTYGAVIRFYVPAPRGIDPTQDDFAQTLMLGSGAFGAEEEAESWIDNQDVGPEQTGMKKEKKKRLWVPIGICVTSSLPIVGVMEAVLMRCCEMLASRPKIEPSGKNKINNMIQRHLANLILNCQQPLAGAVNCSVPFLLGEPLQVRLAPKAGLPPLPHGNAVSSVCRLLGPEGFIFVLAALLTESKILLHSHNVANCAMVAEVMTALIYPFNWSMPYIPVLPTGMLEFIEAPLSYLLGIPSSCLEQNMVDSSVLDEVVVVDLDSGFSSPDWKTRTTKYKSPTPLPSLVASNISRAVYRLLRALENEHDYEERHNHPVSNASDRLPRIHPESKAEREFRIAIALEMGGLVRGYQDCLVFVSTSQPVFNREKFLKRAPALFIEEPSGGAIGSRANKVVKTNRRILSSRSKRFLSILVNCQHFHQFLEMLRSEECLFFHEVMEMWIKGDESSKGGDVSVFESSSSFDHNKAIAHLSKSLQALEDKVATYEVKLPHSNKSNGSCPEDDVLQDEDYQILSREKRFPRNVLQQIDVGVDQGSDLSNPASNSLQDEGVHHATLSVQYLVELEKNPWRYCTVLDIKVPDSNDSEGSKNAIVSEVTAGDQSVLVCEKVKLRDAIGDRKYRAWKLSREQLGDDTDFSGSNSLDDSIMAPGDFGTQLDLTSLLTSTTEDTFSESSSVSSVTNLLVGSRSGARSSMTPEQQRVANAKDRDVLRRCLEKAYSAGPNSSTLESKDFSEFFTHHGRDLVSEAEVALRNPSAQHFLLSLLSKRAKLDENQKQLQGQSPSEKRLSRKSGDIVSSGRLEPIAFECVVRLCCAMLDSCMEAKDYEPAYLLLCHTAGLHTVQHSSNQPNASEELSAADAGDDAAMGFQPMYMTARIGLHPLFADLGLWKKVMGLHLTEKQSMGTASDKVSLLASRDSAGSDGSLPSLSRSESFENEGPATDGGDEKEYEAAVATLYEMLGYGIPAEELARFATKVSQECGWFAPNIERGQSLLLLARRLSMRRELAESGGVAPGDVGDLDMMQGKVNSEIADHAQGRGSVAGSPPDDDDSNCEMVEIGWCHPAAPTATSLRGPAHAASSTAATGMLRGGGQQTEYMNRSAVTALATFGPSVVVSGGLDGGVFLAHLAPKADDDGSTRAVVRGLHLDWGSSGSRAMPGASASSADGEYGVGAVSCLAAATGTGGHHQHQRAGSTSTKDVMGLMDEEDIIKDMEDSRIIAGTTCGDLRIWSVKDVYAAMHATQTGEDSFGLGGDGARVSHIGSGTGATSSYVPATALRRRRGSSTTSEPGGYGGGNNPFNRLKFSLRGRALSGHRGGVVCVDVPSHVYRPDSVVTGGADGLIKLWSLRMPSAGRSSSSSFYTASTSTAAGQLSRRLAANRGGDALSILSGHGGRVLCVKTAWHGDRLLSGGADRTIRIWDIMASGSSAALSGGTGSDAACLHTLSGHFGWVTQVQYWGPNTIISGSTDRSIALWDARVRNSPLFVLRHHHAPISSLLVGSRTDPLMVSAASDGTVTTWDFRLLSGAAQNDGGSSEDSPSKRQTGGAVKHCKVVRRPAAVMNLGAGHERFSLARAGPVLLSRGDRSARTVFSAGSDAIVREWDVSTGQLVNDWNSGHCDALTSLTSLSEASQSLFGMSGTNDGLHSVGGTLTSSWDGTIRLRRRVPKPKV